LGDVVIFGVGHSAELALAFFERQRKRVVGFTVDPDYLADARFRGRPVVAWPELERHFPPETVELFAPISYRERNAIRRARFHDGRGRGYRFANLIHPSALIEGSVEGENCFIHENVVVQPHATVGENCVLWSGSCVAHHSSVGAHSFLAIHVAVSGGVSIGEQCFLGVRAAIRDNVELGRECMVGAGATVMRSLEDREVVPSGACVREADRLR